MITYLLYLFIFCLFFSFLSFFFRCPLGQIRASPERAECVFDSDCFGVNQCLNGGTCISESDFRFATSGSGRSISGGRSLTSGTFHGSRSRSRTFCRCPASFEGQRCETVKGPITLNANRDFVIIIIFAIATLLSKFYFYFIFLISISSKHFIFSLLSYKSYYYLTELI